MTSLFIGDAPIFDGIKEQYIKKGWDVWHYQDFSSFQEENILSFHMLYLASDCGCSSPVEADSHSLNFLSRVAKLRKEHGAERIPCHLLLRSGHTLWMLQSMSFESIVNEMFEVWPFTVESLWAENLLLTSGREQAALMPLDRESIGEKSNQTVHLVIFNLTAMGKAIAYQASLIAHYPNFISNHSLKTRITVVERDADKVAVFKRCYQFLFDNSFVRSVNLEKQNPESSLHRPAYFGKREEFVDIEWEFVQGGISHPVIQQKLELWSQSESQQLSLVICGDNDDINVQNAFTLPKIIFERHIPVAVQCRDSGMLHLSAASQLYGGIIPFGMDDVRYDISQPLVKMAKYLNYFYEQAFNKKEIPTFIHYDEVEKSWKSVSYINQLSNIHNAMTFAVKMRSLGHDVPDWADFYAMTDSETEMMAEVEHNRWVVERLLSGFRPPTDMEKDEITRDISLKRLYKSRYIHLDLCSYSELMEDEQQVDTRIYDRILTFSIPLIVNSIYRNE